MPQIVAAGVRQQQQQQVLFTFISEVSRYTLVVDREGRKGGGGGWQLQLKRRHIRRDFQLATMCEKFLAINFNNI